MWRLTKVRRRRVAASIVALAAAGTLVGLAEGWLYPTTGGPRMGEWVYWPVMLAVLYCTLVGAYLVTMLVANDGRDLKRAGAMGAAALPTAVVVQDATSLFAQGLHPWQTNWWAEFFGVNFLTLQTGWGPVWYAVAAIGGLLLVVYMSKSKPRTSK